MKKPLLTIAFIFSFQLLFSQQDSILRYFKFRNIDYRAINISGNGSSYYDKQELGVGNRDAGNSTGSAGVTYYQLRSTDKILLTMFGGFGANFSRSKNQNDDKERSFYITPRVYVHNQWFSKKFFAELGTDISTVFGGSRRIINNPEVDYKSNNASQLYTLTVGIGKGRLENITSMQNALWLNKALQEKERLSRELSGEELNGLGDAVAVANNTRVLDGRKRTQYVLASVDDYFQQHGLINKNDIRYFSNLNDILFFAINLPRLSGKEIFIRASPSLVNYSSHSTSFPEASRDEQESKNTAVKISAGVNKYVPVNLRHQNNFGMAALFNYVAVKNSSRNFLSGNLVSEYASKGDLKQAALTAFYEHAIYPNTRTIINFRLESQAGYHGFDEMDFFGTAGLYSTMNYFISYRTSFNINLGANYRNNFYDIGQYINVEPKTIQFDFSAGFQISI